MSARRPEDPRRLDPRLALALVAWLWGVTLAFLAVRELGLRLL